MRIFAPAMSEVPVSFRTALKEALKIVVYFIFLALFINLVLGIDVRLGCIRSEMSFTENSQLVFILLTILTFVQFWRENPRLKRATALIVGFFCTVFIRECDGFLDVIVHSFWVVPALAVTAVAVIYALREPRRCALGLVKIFLSPGCFIVCGVILLFGFSRLFGTTAFWKAVMSDAYLRDVKVVAEEGTELLAYGLILLGARMTLKEFRRRREHKKSAEKLPADA